MNYIIQTACRYLAALLVGVLLVSCGGGGGAPVGTTVSTPIGANGGIVTSADGKLTLTIPAGALGNTEIITIESIDPVTLPPEFSGLNGQAAYKLGPDGTQFAQPVGVSVNLNDPPLQADGSVKGSLVALVTSVNGALESLGNVALSVNMTANTATATGKLTHFSHVVTSSKFDVAIILTKFPTRTPEFTYQSGEIIPVNVLVSRGPRVSLDADVSYFDPGIEQYSSSPVLPVQPSSYDTATQYPILTPLGRGHIFPQIGLESVDANYNYACANVPQTQKGRYSPGIWFSNFTVVFSDSSLQAEFDKWTQFLTKYEVILEQEVTCVGSGVSLDNTPPTVASVYPLNGADNVPVTDNVVVSFSEAMGQTTIHNATVLLIDPSLALVAGGISSSVQPNAYIFNPNASLAPNTTYTVKVTTGAKDVAGNPLAAEFTSTFTTAAQVATNNLTLTGSNVPAAFAEPGAPICTRDAAIGFISCDRSIGGLTLYLHVIFSAMDVTGLGASWSNGSTLTCGSATGSATPCNGATLSATGELIVNTPLTRADGAAGTANVTARYQF